jgi:hypothetical protein
MSDPQETAALEAIAEEVVLGVLRPDRRLTATQVKAAALEAGVELDEADVASALRRLRHRGRARFHTQPAGWCAS